MTVQPPGLEAAAAVRLAPRGRFFAAAVSAAIHLAAFLALLLWHVTPSLQDFRQALTVVALPDQAPPKENRKEPPPPPEPQKQRGEAMKDKAGAPAPKASAAPLAAAVVPTKVPAFVPSAIPSTGAQANAGNALAGTGTGGGGQGNGPGGGGTGNGGSPPPPNAAVDPEVIRGSFRQSDYPKELRELGPSGTTWAEVIVGTNGRVTSCRISRPSGVPQFDAKTCQILVQRFRYRPARDAAGRPVAAPDSFSVDWDYIDLTE